MHYDVKISGARKRTHDLWIRKWVYYSLLHSALWWVAWDPLGHISGLESVIYWCTSTLASSAAPNCAWVSEEWAGWVSGVWVGWWAEWVFGLVSIFSRASYTFVVIKLRDIDKRFYNNPQVLPLARETLRWLPVNYIQFLRFPMRTWNSHDFCGDIGPDDFDRLSTWWFETRDGLRNVYMDV